MAGCCLCTAEKCVGSSSTRKVGRVQGINFWKIFCCLEALPPSHSVSTCSRTTCPKLEPFQSQTRALGLPSPTSSALVGREAGEVQGARLAVRGPGSHQKRPSRLDGSVKKL